MGYHDHWCEIGEHSFGCRDEDCLRFDRTHCGKVHFSPGEGKKRIISLEAALKDAKAHVEELADAWQRGCIHETDGLGGTRSNRNMAVLLNLRAALGKKTAVSG
jgi:hypothetical protein